MEMSELRARQWRERAEYLEAAARSADRIKDAAAPTGVSVNNFAMMLKYYTGKTFTQIKEQS